MDPVDVIKSCLDSIRQLSDDVVDAVIYLDGGCLEAFQFIGAFSLLLELKVRAVCSLESMSPLDTVANWNSASTDPATKMVVFTTRFLSNAHRYILRCLSTHQTIVDCRIFTSISEVAHSACVDCPLGLDAFREYGSLLLMDYEELVKNDKKRKMDSDKINKFITSTGTAQEGSFYSPKHLSAKSAEGFSPNSVATSTGYAGPDGFAGLVISVSHFPMGFCALSPRVFILPSEGSIAEARLSDKHFDSLSPGLPIISTGHGSDSDEIPPGATLTADFLYYLASKMDLKLEIFSVGDLSKSIGKILTDMSSLYDVGRRNRRSAGLLIIDRTLDVLTPCCHGDSVVDWMLSSLPRKERAVYTSRAKSSQPSTKSSTTHVQRAPLDVKIPLEKVVCAGDSPARNEMLINSITAFISGWRSGGVGDAAGDSGDHKDAISPISQMTDNPGLLTGSLVSVDNYQGVNYLEALLGRGIKDGAMLVKKWILGIIRQNRLSVNLKNRLAFPSASELLSMARLLASNQTTFIRNRGIIQLAVASLFALSEPFNSRWNAFSSAERILKMSNGDSSQILSSQIRDIISRSVLLRSHGQGQSSESDQGLFSFQDSLLLAIVGYILAGVNFPTSGSSGPFSWEEERSLKEAVLDAIMELPTTQGLGFLHGLEEELEAYYRKRKTTEKLEDALDSFSMEDLDDNWGSWEDDSDHKNEQSFGEMQLKLELRDRVDHLFKFFHKISGLRWRNQGFIDLETRIGSESFSSKGLLYKLLLMILAKYDIPGLEYHSSAVGRFLKSGFGRFGLGQAKPNLGDQNIIIVFVVGGINCLEIRELQEAISESGRLDVELMIGGTTLLTPDDMFDLILGSSSYI
ncbi:unnamed protein product [Spirodela intermedia]|uniref:Uncharacterized protein n=1 Tax=Spirodela intermedia TaxID=51605 RepID=A0A7I8KMC0_SPIIN|nr:unnamed protein product [Spirodela intermedia]